MNQEDRRLKDRIDSIDLEPIKFKLMKEFGWALEYSDHVEVLYKGYLLLSQLNLDQPLVPTKAIDEMWHQHILDTRKYEDDCARTLGRFFHHFPYFGVRNDEDARNLEIAFAETRKLFVEHLGVDLVAPSVDTEGGRRPGFGGEETFSSTCKHECSGVCKTSCWAHESLEPDDTYGIVAKCKHDCQGGACSECDSHIDLLNEPRPSRANSLALEKIGRVSHRLGEYDSVR